MPQRKDFWNKQYKKPTHLALSSEPSEDLVKFTNFLTRHHGKKFLNVTVMVTDLGCGNGRNLIHLSEHFGVHGVGYDTSREALMQARAKTAAKELPLVFEERSIAKPIPLEDTSATIVLDMMSSHVLNKDERERLKDEIVRILKPGGWFFFKSFLLDGDRNAERLLKENPGEEPGTYVHPEIGVPEHVWEEQELREFFEPYFIIHAIEKSYKHVRASGEAWKRRTVAVYLQKT